MAGTTINPYRFGGQLGYRRDGTNRDYVRARNLDTGRGRWLSRDPLGFNGGHQNPYLYATGNPTNRLDPSGNVIIRPINKGQWNTGNAPGCGYYLAQWDFVLEQPARLEGYFVQEIQQSGDMTTCSGIAGSSLQQKPYWEAFPVLQHTKVWVCRFSNCRGKGVSGYTDQFTSNFYPNSTGNYSKEGTVKFFWKKTIGDLNKDPNWSAGTNPQAGVLLTSNKKPKWWDKPSDQGSTAGHHGNSTWCCCPSATWSNAVDIQPR